jgi:uncharacterized protein (DUF1697 family)
MARYFAFLRAINVGGHTVKMDKLRLVFEAMGFIHVETFIASGNVIFSASSKSAGSLENKIEFELKKQLGFEATTFLRTGEELTRIASYKAFAPAAVQAATAYNIAFLKKPLGSTQVSALSSLKTAIDDFAVNDREIYWLCQKKQSESTFSNAVLEKKLGVKSTLRGANTVVSMVEKFIHQLE